MTALERVGGPGSTPERVRATLAILRHYKAFLASPCREMKSPEQWGVYYSKADVERRLTFLLHAAINRRAGILDCPTRKHESDYLRGLWQDQAALNTPRLIVRHLRTPELQVRFADRLRQAREDYA